MDSARQYSYVPQLCLRLLPSFLLDPVCSTRYGIPLYWVGFKSSKVTWKALVTKLGNIRKELESRRGALGCKRKIRDAERLSKQIVLYTYRHFVSEQQLFSENATQAHILFLTSVVAPADVFAWLLLCVYCRPTATLTSPSRKHQYTGCVWFYVEFIWLPPSGCQSGYTFETMNITSCTVYHLHREGSPFYITLRSDLGESQCLQIGQIKQIFLSETGIINSGSLGK